MADDGLPKPQVPELRIETFGCRLNAYESESMRAMAAEAGVGDAIVVNTCAVTNEAVRQARQSIRKLRAERPEARIVVTGCAAQIDPQSFAAMPEVDLVLGNQEKMAPQSWARIAGEARGPREEAEVRVDDIMSAQETASHLLDGFGTRARAFVQIQNGCDHRCTFCIIPYGRGPSRSAAAGVVVDQIKRLVGRGYREVVLTGVDMTSWGADLPALGGRTPTLGDLVQRILKLVPDLPRLRISSIDSVEIDPALFDAVAEPRLAPHLHLSLQAGDDLILKRMKRRHLSADAERVCAQIRERRPEMVFGADFIAGFPTETEEMFEQTLAHVEACGLTYLHVFPFSARPGTPAARMPQTPRAVAKARAARLRELGGRRLAAYLQSEVGARRSVLMENARRGRTEGYAEVIVDQDLPEGEIVAAEITGSDGTRLNGRAIAG